MGIIGIDAAATVTDDVLNRLVAKGGAFVGIYFKYMADATLQLVARHGMKIVSIYETTAKRALDGAAGGTADGKQAMILATKFGQPLGSAIFCTADFDAIASQDAAVLAYIGAFKAQIPGYRMGIYANGAVCAAALQAGVAELTWLAGGSGMTGTKVFAAANRATIEQDVGDKQNLNLGINIDSDTALVAEYGGWSPATDMNAVTPAMIVQTVRLLQTQEQALGLLPAGPGEVDGVLGAKTAAAAVAAYRAAQ